MDATAINQRLGYQRYRLKRELEQLPSVLVDAEELVNLAWAHDGPDQCKGMVALTNRRLLFFSAGRRRSTHREIPVGAINHVQYSTEKRNGTLHVSGRLGASQGTDGTLSGDYIGLHVSGVRPRERGREIADYLRNLARERLTTQDLLGSGHPMDARADLHTQLQRLKALRDEGLLTDEEFEAKRQVLVNRL